MLTVSSPGRSLPVPRTTPSRPIPLTEAASCGCGTISKTTVSKASMLPSATAANVNSLLSCPAGMAKLNSWVFESAVPSAAMSE